MANSIAEANSAIQRLQEERERTTDPDKRSIIQDDIFAIADDYVDWSWLYDDDD